MLNPPRWPTSIPLTQWTKGGAHLLAEDLRLLPGCEVTALVDLVEVNEVRIDLLGPAARRLEDLAGEDGERHRQRQFRRRLPGRKRSKDALCLLPVESRRRCRGARQPVQRDVVDDPVAGQAARRLAVDDRVRDFRVTVRGGVEHPGCGPDWRV